MSPSPVLLLAGSHDLATAPATQALLVEAASGAGSLQLDMREVESADVALVQLVLALDAQLRARGDQLECLASPALRDLFERCGAELALN